MPRTTDAPGEDDLARLEALLRHAGPEDLGGWEEVGPLVAEVRRLRAELAVARPVVALIERAATETYMGANEELLLMAKGRAFDRLIAAWDQIDHARPGGPRRPGRGQRCRSRLTRAGMTRASG